MTLDRNKLRENVELPQYVHALLDELEAAEQARDLALANADFWERELNNFRRNAAHRAEQLAKEKVEAAEERVRELTQQAERCRNLLPNICQIVDVVRQEWGAEKCWSDWDQSVRDEITQVQSGLQKVSEIRNMLEGK